MKLSSVYLVFFLLLGTCVSLAEKSPHSLSLTTEKVIVFKDGYSLILKKGTAITDKNGEVYTDEVPDSVILGTFWAFSTPANKLVHFRAGWTHAVESVAKEFPCGNPLEILQANEGKFCKIIGNDQNTYEGTILKVLSQKTLETLNAHTRELLGLPKIEMEENTFVSSISSISGSSFILGTTQGEVLLPISQIKTLLIQGMKTTLSRTITESKRTKRLTFHFAEPEKKCEILLMYFGPGVRWIPTYQLDLSPDSDKKLVTVSLQAEIINEAEDFSEVPFDLVVGVPNFRFRQTISPLVLEKALENTLQASDPQLMGQFRNDNNAYTMRSSEFRREASFSSGVSEGGSITLPSELTASGAQDLFMYHLPKLNLSKGQRAAVAIFNTQTTYRDIYTWDIHIKQNSGQNSSFNQESSPLNLSLNKVWHQIEILNNTPLPWTTGAVMLMQQKQPLGQELLAYTSPKDEVRVPVTVSVETRGSFSEKEVARKLDALKWNGYNYAEIQRELALDLCNNKSVPIDAFIRVQLGGKFVRISHEGKGTLNPYKAEDWYQYQDYPGVNNSSSIEWKVKLKPGETFTPTVLYHYYTRY